MTAINGGLNETGLNFLDFFFEKHTSAYSRKALPLLLPHKNKQICLVELAPAIPVFILENGNIQTGIEPDDVELALGEMCNVVNNAYGGDKGGFISGQVYKLSGFVSDQQFSNGNLTFQAEQPG